MEKSLSNDLEVCLDLRINNTVEARIRPHDRAAWNAARRFLPRLPEAEASELRPCVVTAALLRTAHRDNESSE